MRERTSQLPKRHRVMERLVVCVLATGVALSLQGCETPYERMLRLSCHWNKDIKLVGCDRYSYAHCIDNCEFCLGKKGTPMEGKSDECNQLKCAAYCAKKMNDKCSKTYQELCDGAVEEIQISGSSCDVKCSAATGGRAPNLWLFLSLACVFAFNGVGVRMPSCSSLFFVACVIVISASLQGCAKNCPKSTPTLPNWKLDIDGLDKKAGCKNEWSLGSGNPCASDVPVVWAKKGVQGDADNDFITGNVENEDYECQEWVTDNGANKFCRMWTTREGTCAEIDFGLCTCVTASPNGNYCETWSCMSKEADQHECWKGCCGKGCSPCVVCGLAGSSPFPMNYDVFKELLAEDGTASIMSSGMAEAVRELRGKHYTTYKYGGACIASRDIKSYHEAPCDRWREIETEISYCACSKEHNSGMYCESWTCEEKDVGMFSILFAKPRAYTGLIDGQEVENYNCNMNVEIGGGRARCGRWKGDISSFEEVEETLCEVCGGKDEEWGENCKTWICNEYELPVVHDVDRWGQRFGWSLLHMAWILPLLCGTYMPPPDGKDYGPYYCGQCCYTLIVCTLLWMIGFLRYKSGEESRWVAPGDPFLGLWIPNLIGWFAAIVLSIPLYMFFGKMAIPPGVIGVPLFMTCSWLWTSGSYIAGPFVLIYLCGLLAFCLCGKGWPEHGQL